MQITKRRRATTGGLVFISFCERENEHMSFSMLRLISTVNEKASQAEEVLVLTLLNAGGGGIRPPYHINVVPRKMLKEKVANFL